MRSTVDIEVRKIVVPEGRLRPVCEGRRYLAISVLSGTIRDNVG